MDSEIFDALIKMESKNRFGGSNFMDTFKKNPVLLLGSGIVLIAIVGGGIAFWSWNQQKNKKDQTPTP